MRFKLNRRFGMSGVLAIILSTCAFASLSASQLSGIGRHVEGSNVDNVGSYAWWYGCSPTAAGLVLGYYDRNGYKGQSFDNLVPGGVAEVSTFGSSSALVNSIIASSAHVTDFYSNGYNASGDDSTGNLHTFNCLADFMGTSQDAAGNTNGATTFYYFDNGSRFYVADAVANNLQNMDGTYGIGAYINYCGYSYASIYTQSIDTQVSSGFDFKQYMAEIDAGRLVLIQLDGHTAVGYGYDAKDDLIYLRDSNDSSTSLSMTWGGSYDGMSQWGVTVVELVPEPSTTVLLFIGGAGMFFWKWRRSKSMRQIS
jgi:hypothetical protein